MHNNCKECPKYKHKKEILKRNKEYLILAWLLVIGTHLVIIKNPYEHIAPFAAMWGLGFASCILIYLTLQYFTMKRRLLQK